MGAGTIGVLVFLGVLHGAVSYTTEYLGCYTDSSSRDLPNNKIIDENGMTPSRCGDHCQGLGFTYFGVQYGKECYCGNSYGSHGEVTDSSCDKPCSGDISQMCGSAYKNSVYEIKTPYTLIYKGCYKDEATRDLSGEQKDIDDSTRSRCADYCYSQGYRFSGNQYGYQCFCGDSFGAYGSLSESSCDRACPGKDSEKCGGAYANTVFEMSGSGDYVGCYKDASSRDLPSGYIQANDMTKEKCRANCAGYEYFGLQYSKQCYCGNSYGRHGKVSESSCSMACSGDSSQMCGAGYTNSIYSTSRAAVSYMGCYKDSSNRDLPSEMMTSDDMNKEMCSDHCSSEGYTYFGLQYGMQCFCGNSYGGQGKLDESACNMPCVGDADQTCGAGYTNSIYSTDASETASSAPTVETIVPHDWCYDDFPILDGLLCYQVCRAGYAHRGGGPVCWAKCPGRTTDIGALCVKDSYGRGAGDILNTCASGQQNGLLCYPECNSGYYGVGPVCWANCNSGYTDDGALCRRNAHIYNRDVSDCPWTDKCGLCGGPWYNVCGQRRNCGGSCNSGYHNDGCTCRRDVHIYAKDTYGRGVGDTMTCQSNQEQDGALCYDLCNSGYNGVGPVCWSTCSGETVDTGTQCQKNSYGRGVGKAINCLQIPSINDFTNVSGMVQIFNQSTPANALQAVACAAIYLQMKPWMTIASTFNKCFNGGEKWMTISLSFTGGASAGVTLSGEVGVAADVSTGKGLCFFGFCYGVTTDSSVGVGIAVGWWRTVGDIPGESQAFSISFDIPFTDIGFAANFITNMDDEYIGTVFEFSVGVGDACPFNVGFTKCNTPEDSTMAFDF